MSNSDRQCCNDLCRTFNLHALCKCFFIRYSNFKRRRLFSIAWYWRHWEYKIIKKYPSYIICVVVIFSVIGCCFVFLLVVSFTLLFFFFVSFSLLLFCFLVCCFVFFVVVLFSALLCFVFCFVVFCLIDSKLWYQCPY